MKQLTKKQLNELYGFCRSQKQRDILGNGEVGYCKSEKTLIVCCGNCGDYSRVKIDKRKM